MFKVGDEVICVGDMGVNLKEGGVYPVLFTMNDGICILIETLTGPGVYVADRFVHNTPEGRAKWMQIKMEESNG